MKLNISLDRLTNAERKQFFDLVEKSERKGSFFVPEMNDEYWLIGTEYGFSEPCCGRWCNNVFDNFQFSIGNCFRTEEEARFALEKLKVIHELKMYAAEHNECEMDWADTNQEKISLAFNHDCTQRLDTATNYWLQKECCYFTSQKIAKEAIKAVGKERIAKYLFGVEED
jgi:hypothetical protein